MPEGERNQLDHVMRQHLPEVLGFALRLTGCQHRAEELTQETMLRALRHWSDFRGDSNPRTWLFAIVSNVFRDSLRNRQNRQQPLPGEIETGHSGPGQQSIANELGEAVARHVSGLPPKQREVLVLLTWQGMSVKEVAEILQMKPSSVYTNLHHARNTLKEKLKSFMESGSPLS